MIIKRFIEALKVEKYYLIFACALFLGSCLYAVFFYEHVNKALSEAGLFNQLEQVAKKIEKNPTFPTVFSTIFFNNVSASLLAIGSGLIFGMFPTIMLVSNGLMLGVAVVGSAAKANVNPFLLFVTTILPHGIFELPAIFIGAAFGVHIGMAMIRVIIALFLPNRREKSILEWKGIGNRFLVITSGVVIFLFFAAIIESGLILLMRAFI